MFVRFVVHAADVIVAWPSQRITASTADAEKANNPEMPTNTDWTENRMEGYNPKVWFTPMAIRCYLFIRVGTDAETRTSTASFPSLDNLGPMMLLLPNTHIYAMVC